MSGKKKRSSHGYRTIKPEPTPVATPARLDQLNDTSCRWPLWSDDINDTSRLYCNDAAPGISLGSPYCARHTRMSYRSDNYFGRAYFSGRARAF